MIRRVAHHQDDPRTWMERLNSGNVVHGNNHREVALGWVHAQSAAYNKQKPGIDSLGPGGGVISA